MMKKIITILFIMLSLKTFAQFPTPTNFEFSYDYIMIDDFGECAGEGVYGPTYCSHFNWVEPETAGITSTLEYYNIYVSDDASKNINIIASVTNTFYNVEAGIVGDIWITAVYSNPEGESEPSNIETNNSLPISIEETLFSDKLKIYYDRDSQTIKIKNGEPIKTIQIFNINGKLIKSINYWEKEICLLGITKGIYIIEIVTDKFDVIRQKIIK